jgi:hypothetical protein
LNFKKENLLVHGKKAKNPNWVTLIKKLLIPRFQKSERNIIVLDTEICAYYSHFCRFTGRKTQL